MRQEHAPERPDNLCNFHSPETCNADPTWELAWCMLPMQEQGVLDVHDPSTRFNQVVLVMDLARAGSLTQVLQLKGGTLREEHAVQRVLRPLLRALWYMHGMGILHRDIKPGEVWDHRVLVQQCMLRLCTFKALALLARAQAVVS